MKKQPAPIAMVELLPTGETYLIGVDRRAMMTMAQTCRSLNLIDEVPVWEAGKPWYELRIESEHTEALIDAWRAGQIRVTEILQEDQAINHVAIKALLETGIPPQQLGMG